MYFLLLELCVDSSEKTTLNQPYINATGYKTQNLHFCVIITDQKTLEAGSAMHFLASS